MGKADDRGGFMVKFGGSLGKARSTRTSYEALRWSVGSLMLRLGTMIVRLGCMVGCKGQVYAEAGRH